MTFTEAYAKDRLAPSAAGQSDLLCSIALISQERLDQAPRMVAELVAFLDQRFRFWEILVVTSPDARQASPQAFETIAATPGVRVLLTRRHLDRHRLVPLAATESIGDVVLFILDEEFDLVRPQELWAAAEQSGHSVYLIGRAISLVDRAGAAILSSLVGFSTEPRILRSCAHFRDRLTWLLQRPDTEMAFRFVHLWSASGGEVVVLPLDPSLRARGPAPRRTLIDRALAAADVVSHAAPRLLKLVALACLVGLIGAFAYLVYALINGATRSDLAAGWLTTSLAISGSTLAICAALGCIALGVARLLEVRGAHASADILQETSNLDRFDSPGALNVVQGR